MGVGHSIPRMIGCGLDEAEMHLWCRDLPGDYGGIENVPTTSMFEKFKRFAQLQDLGAWRMKKARCGKCHENVRLSQLAIFSMDRHNRCWHCWNHRNPASHTLGDFK